ncbi:MAG: MFS transporter, partial [Deltaproteobacteria bacterium]|nr:MFS transporter [Deltaproteobacteria bacterium]
VGYKATDDFGQFVVEVYGVDQVEAASISSLMAWIRPVAALFAGWLADRVLSSRVILGGFAVLAAGFASLALIDVQPTALWVFVSQLVIACIAVYGLRGVYFALFEQAKVPTAVTGTAVGIVSVVGYTPDIFVGLVLGHYLDTYPGAQGHHLFFGFVAGAAVVGLVATAAFSWLVRSSRPSFS